MPPQCLSFASPKFPPDVFSGPVADRCPVPCCHQFYWGAQRPKTSTLPEIKKNLPPNYPVRTSIQFQCIIHERQTARQPLARKECLIRMAIDNIRYFTKRKKRIVAEWVHFPTDTGDSFVLSIPMSVLDCIVEG
jgi:hypothetical protein